MYQNKPFRMQYIEMWDEDKKQVYLVYIWLTIMAV